MKRGIAFFTLALLAACDQGAPPVGGTSTFLVTIDQVNGMAPPGSDNPLPANHGDHPETWSFTIDARDDRGQHADFNGFVRLSSQPGAVQSITTDNPANIRGRNILIDHGTAKGVVTVTSVYGEARLWAEDIGYLPAPSGQVPACSDGKDNNNNALIDFPADPGCAFADDDSEDEGSFAAGVSPAVHYALPKISDVQGQASTTPYPYESINIKTQAPQRLVVTRVAVDGFNVTDVAEQSLGYNHIFAFNFSTPINMRVCDRVTLLAGTVNEFFGFTELSFPSYELEFPIEGVNPCEVPDPILIAPGPEKGDCTPSCGSGSACIDNAGVGTCQPCAPQCDSTTVCVAGLQGAPICAALANDPIAMEKAESGLVRLRGYAMPKKFGPNLVVNNVPKEDASNCDLNGDGAVDFSSASEGSCASACEADPNCSEWTTFSARSEIKVNKGSSVMQVDLSRVTEFDPTANKALVLDDVTGTLREFSGGSLNWTVEARCADDLICQGATGCSPTPLDSTKACVHLRTLNGGAGGGNDNEGTN